MDPPTTDEALLRQFLAGDPAALESLAHRYEGPLLALAAALLGGHTDMAADAIQETWLRVIRFGRGFNARSSFKTWLYRIAINQCRSARAKGSGATACPPSSAASRADDCDADDRSHLRAALRSLSPDRRIVVLLCYHRGLTHHHAAEILGLPLGTLKTRLRAAMTDLRAKLHAETAP
jgi:RNA polymerase sigma-70 factor, ECF subfamily